MHTHFIPSVYQSNVASAILGASVVNPSNQLPVSQQAGITEKRKQVKNACTNCQKACKKCSDARPCPRCEKHGIADSCVSSVRKERKKGFKRGPYKRRSKTGGEPAHTSQKGNGSTNSGNVPGQYSQGAHPNTIPFGYPSNLNQYGQSFNQFVQYATFHKDQIIGDPYKVKTVYSPFQYPVILPDGTENALKGDNVKTITDEGRPNTEKEHAPSAPESCQNPSASTTRPSTPTSLATLSSSSSAEDEEAVKHERLSQLCAAALNQNDKPSTD